MPLNSSQTRFLLRGSGLLIVLLVFWWFALLSPLLLLLRGSAEICWGIFVNHAGKLIAETPAGDWSLRVPVEFTMPASSREPAPVRIHSIDFDVARTEAIAFTFSLPVYWAIVLAAPGIRRNLRALVLGSIAVTAVETILFLAFAEISAHNVAAQWSRQLADLSGWILRFGYYLVVDVVPYVAPFFIALGIHRELRRQIFRSGDPETAAVSADRPEHSNRNKRRLQ
jgi:hypothetical protein